MAAPLAVLVPAGLAAANAGVALWAIGANWIGVVRGVRSGAGWSPILLVAPLCALLAAGFALRAEPSIPGQALWVAPLVAALLDPACLPLIVWALVRRARRRSSGGGPDRG